MKKGRRRKMMEHRIASVFIISRMKYNTRDTAAECRGREIRERVEGGGRRRKSRTRRKRRATRRGD